MRRADLSRVEKVNLAKLLSLVLGLKPEDFDTKLQQHVWQSLENKPMTETNSGQQSDCDNSNKRKRSGDEDTLGKGSTIKLFHDI